MVARKTKAPWVIAGGKIGEVGHCERCGTGLNMGGTQHLGVVTAAMKAFVSIHEHCREGQFKETEAATPSQWIEGRDTGISSCTIYAVMMNTPSPMCEYHTPRDPQDFGRCYRLLALFPAWRPRLGEVAARFPIWKPFVENWDKLTAMYERERAVRDPEYPMYQFMRKLEKEAIAP